MTRIAFALLVLLSISPAQAQLRGHGGPVRALAVSADGKTAITGSFDSSAIVWNLERNVAEQVLRFHDSAVNAAAILQEDRFATAGADGKIAIWQRGVTTPQTVLEGHTAPIVSLAVSPDGQTLASASWDHTVRLWPLSGGTPRVLEGHTQNVNGVAFRPDGKAVVSVGYDWTSRFWPLAPGEQPTSVQLPSELNVIAITADGEQICGGADGKLYILGNPISVIEDAASTPIVALAVSGDGRLIAAAGIRGAVTIIDRKARRVLRTLIGPGLPVWSAAFLPDNRTLLTGGADRVVRRWDAVTGEHIGQVAMGPDDPLAAYKGDPGAEVFRACVACHTFAPDQGNRAGPTLHGLFGRRIATLPGYNFSPALKKLEIVWTPETVSKLFDLGPATYTPGTKMPEQTIGSADDRAALVKFLEKVTR